MHYWLGIQTRAATVETTELPHDSVIPLLGVCPKATKTRIQKDMCSLMLTVALCTITKLRKQLKCSLING